MFDFVDDEMAEMRARAEDGDEDAMVICDMMDAAHGGDDWERDDVRRWGDQDDFMS